MSADEFDPMVERLFSRSPAMADADLFAAEVRARLEKRSRVRGFALGLAGVIGGCVAVRETMNFSVSTGLHEGQTLTQGFRAASLTAQASVQSGLDGLGVTSIDLTSGSGMQMFWIVAGALFVLLAAGLVRLSQDV